MNTLQRRRRSLATITLLGAVVVAMVATGVFAVFSDRATTGDNTLESPAVSTNVDLELASVNPDGTCGSFVDDLSTGLFTVSDDVTAASVAKRVCLRNAGSVATAVALSTLDLVDVDPACTGNESSTDPTCGGNGQGELGSALSITAGATDASAPCPDLSVTPNPSWMPDAAATNQGALTGLADNEVPFIGDLAPNEHACVLLAVQYLPLPATQSDRVTWRLAFDGVAPASPTCVDDQLDPLGTVVNGPGSWNGVICPGLSDQFQIPVTPGSTIDFDLSYVNAAGDLDLVWYVCDLQSNDCSNPSTSDSDTADTESGQYTNSTADPMALVVLVGGHDLTHSIQPFTIQNSYTFTVS